MNGQRFAPLAVCVLAAYIGFSFKLNPKMFPKNDSYFDPVESTAAIGDTVMNGDFLVKVGNPKALDQTLQQMGAVLIGGPENFLMHDGAYVVRPLGDPGFVRFAVEHQGYAKIIGDAPDPAPWDVKL